MTINLYHAQILGNDVKVFVCRDLVRKNGKLDVDVAMRVSEAYDVSIAQLQSDLEALTTHMPYGSSGEGAHCLQGQWEGTPFNKYLSRALKSHQMSVITSMQHCGNQIHIGGFLAAIWFGLYVMSSYFKVELLFLKLCATL